MPQPSSRNRPVRPASSAAPRVERGRRQRRAHVRRQVARLPPRLGAGGGEAGQRLGVGGVGELEVDGELLVAADHLGQRAGDAGDPEGGALVLDALGDRGDPAVGLDHPLVALAGVGSSARRGRPAPGRARRSARSGARSARRRRPRGRRGCARGGRRRARARTSARCASASASSSRAKRTASSRACSASSFTSALDWARIASAIACASSGVKARAVTSMIPAAVS